MNDTSGNNAEIENVEAVAVALAEWWQANARDLAVALRPGHAVGRACIRGHEPADADEPCGAVLDRLDGALARRPLRSRRPREGRGDYRLGSAWIPTPCVALAGMRLRGRCRHMATSCRARTTSSLRLPGVGDYTASAVMSFAFGERIAVVDTNIRRVLSSGVFLGVEVARWSCEPCRACAGEPHAAQRRDFRMRRYVADSAGSPNMPRTALSGATNAPDCIVANAHRSHGTSR